MVTDEAVARPADCVPVCHQPEGLDHLPIRHFGLDPAICEMSPAWDVVA